MSLIPLFTTPLLALFCTIMLHLCALHYFPRWNFLDFPHRYGLKRPPIPYPTGIIAPIIFISIFHFIQDINIQSIGVIFAVILVGCISFIDDRHPLPSFFRLGVQAVASVGIVMTGNCIGGRICSVTNPFEEMMGGSVIDLHGTLPILAIIITVIWIMLTMNALNWFDGIPGQTTAISTIGFLTIGFLSMSDRVHQPELALIAYILAAIALGCFLFDIPPPRVVLGDSGSMFFGLMIGILTVYAGGKVATAFLVLGVPIIDLLFVILKRLSEKHSPFNGSMRGEHLHHRLLAKGWSPQQIILLTAGLGMIFGSTALFLDTKEKFIAGAVLTLIMGGLWRYSKEL